MSLNIFTPQVSKVAKGLEGKLILCYGSNSTGKTLQATRMKKPFHLGFEAGLGAIAGVPFLPINGWADFKKINRQLTATKTLAQAKEMYNTIIFDEVYAASLYCQFYVAAKNGVETMGDTPENGKNLYQEYEREFLREIQKLIKAGYTVYFIGHEEPAKKDQPQIRPKGDKRSMGVIIDNADIIVYLKSNGVDENKKVIKSSGYLAETEDYFARSRFDYMDTFIEEYTAENLERAIIEGIERQEKAEGIKTVTFAEQQASRESEPLDYDDLRSKIIAIGQAMHQAGRVDEVNDVIREHFGKDKTMKDFTKDHVDIMSVVLDELEALDPIEAD